MSGFKDVVGHKNIIKYIQNAVTADAVSHAYILNGERGSGKKLLANLFAMSLQCENRDEDGDACGKCRSCGQAAGGNQPDIIRIVHEKPNTIGVGDIRTQVNDDIMIRPYSSKYKIYIIADERGGAERAFENNRRTAGVCRYHASDGECGDTSSDDPFKMCYDEASQY